MADDELEPPVERGRPRRAVEEEPHRSLGRSILRWLAEFFIYMVVAIVVVALVRVFLVQPFRVPSGSMEQTLQIGDTILAWERGAPERGEIVVFRDDLGWLGPLPSEAPQWKKVLAWLKVLPPQDEQYLVKRLIGLPGDHVVCCDVQGRITVNGHPLDETEYLYQNSSGKTVDPSDQVFDIVVPEGHIFVMGDHRNGSEDSRAHMCASTKVATPTPELTFPSIDSIQGKVVAVLKPMSRIQTFSIPDTFAGVPDPTGSPPSPGQVKWTCP